MPTKRRVYASTKRSHRACMRNFEQYLLKGMIANLHNFYYNRRNGSPDVLARIGLAVDTLINLSELLKEHNDGY